MLSSSFIWFFLFSSYNHTRRRPVRHAERSDGDVANRPPPGWNREWRETRGSFLTSRVSPPHVTLSLLITRSVHVGSYPLLPFTSRSERSEWSEVKGAEGGKDERNLRDQPLRLTSFIPRFYRSCLTLVTRLSLPSTSLRSVPDAQR